MCTAACASGKTKRGNTPEPIFFTGQAETDKDPDSCRCTKQHHDCPGFLQTGCFNVLPETKKHGQCGQHRKEQIIRQITIRNCKSRSCHADAGCRDQTGNTERKQKFRSFPHLLPHQREQNQKSHDRISKQTHHNIRIQDHTVICQRWMLRMNEREFHVNVRERKQRSKDAERPAPGTQQRKTCSPVFRGQLPGDPELQGIIKAFVIILHQCRTCQHIRKEKQKQIRQSSLSVISFQRKETQ